MISRRRLCLVLGLLGGVLAGQCLAAGPAQAASGAAASPEGPAVAMPRRGGVSLPEFQFGEPDSGRAGLLLPDELWASIRGQVGASQRAIGYCAEEMGQYGRSSFRLPTVLRLFSDARLVSRETGRLSDQLLAQAANSAAFGYGWSAGGIGEIARICYQQLDVATARRTMPHLDSTATGDAPPFPLPASEAPQWQALPQAVRDLIVRLYVGAQAATPWMQAAYDLNLPGPGGLAGVSSDSLYRVAMAHRNDQAHGQMATLQKESFELLHAIDLSYAGYATVLWCRYLESALADFVAATANGPPFPRIATFRLPTPLGDILIGGTADDHHVVPAFLVVEIAGDDTYAAGFAASRSLDSPIVCVVDLAGNDRYRDDGVESTPSFGAGIFGLGALVDLAGDDEYAAAESSLGCGYGRRADLGDGHSLAGGVGLLIDGDGDDEYQAQVWAQGCGYWWGLGILEDRAGNDRYRNGKYSSGAAAHFAIGIHVDLAGDDQYNLGNATAKNQFQGHARDGSIGIFIDGGGKDQYEFRSHCAGSGDLGSIGLFWDRRGRDHYLYEPLPLGDSPWNATPPAASAATIASGACSAAPRLGAWASTAPSTPIRIRRSMSSSGRSA